MCQNTKGEGSEPGVQLKSCSAEANPALIRNMLLKSTLVDSVRVVTWLISPPLISMAKQSWEWDCSAMDWTMIEDLLGRGDVPDPRACPLRRVRLRSVRTPRPWNGLWRSRAEALVPRDRGASWPFDPVLRSSLPEEERPEVLEWRTLKSGGWEPLSTLLVWRNGLRNCSDSWAWPGALW